jgi:hypothetical protein
MILLTLILLRPFMFPLCARNLNTPVVCGGLSMAHTSIELSVCRCAEEVRKVSLRGLGWTC